MIEVKRLTKEFKIPVQKKGQFAAIRNLFSGEYTVKHAVDDISFSVGDGEIVGFIGKNGAGKSTTIKMLSGILQPTSGSITVDGIRPFEQRMENAKQIGVVFGQKTQLWWDVPLIESYRLLREIYKIDTAVYQKNLDRYIPMLGLEEVINKPVRQMSLGQRVKSDICAALLHSPKILFLDEPTIGVDVVSKKYLHDFISEINSEKGTTILLTTHDMGDIEKLCSRVVVIDSGHLMYDGDLESMIARFGAVRSLMIEFEKPVPDFEIENAELTRSEGNRKWFSFHRSKATPLHLVHAIDDRFPIQDIAIIEPDIESIVRNLYESS
ncbi:ABC transporter ATP-binding protein [Parablautia muri]|uniref:ABC transporter ATP-binding protein n=1 Tax=Parablautia muri TaxID=2320879 RepID=UPI002ED63D27